METPEPVYKLLVFGNFDSRENSGMYNLSTVMNRNVMGDKMA